jgi:hypothetical protein
LGLVLVYYRPRWNELRSGLAAFVAIGICSLPALALLPGDVAYQADGFALRAPLLPTLGHTAYAFFAGFSLGPSLAELHELPMRDAALQAAPWVALFAAVGGWLLWHGWQEQRRRPYGMGVVFLALASAPVIGAAGALAGVGPKVRYWSWILLPLLVWLAAGAARGWNGRGRWITRVALATLVGAQLLAIANRQAQPRYSNEDIRGVAGYLEAEPSRHAPVFVVSDYMAPPVRYYLNGERTLHRWLPYTPDEGQTYEAVQLSWVIHPRSEADVRGSAPLDDAAIEKWLADLRSLAGEEGRFWLIYSRPFHGDPEARLLSLLKRRGWIEFEREFPGVLLYRGKLAANQ